MKRLLTPLLWLLLPLGALGHVGSPNVFFTGQAGPHTIRVVIRPPAVLPGVAQVDVRVATDGVTNVTLQAALWEAGLDAAPAPVEASAVAGETNFFSGALWLSRAGSFSVHVNVAGGGGSGTAIVPLNSSATKRPAMPPLVGVLLVALGVALSLGVVWLAGVAARESVLEPGTFTGPHERHRARAVAMGAALLLGAALFAGKTRWQRMDREFRNNSLSQPQPVAATVRSNGTLRLLQITPSAADAPGGPAWDTLATDHGKLMHLFLLREPDFDAFAHLHPVRRDARTFENVLPPLPGGRYQLYGEVTYENGLNRTLVATVSLPGSAASAVPQLMGRSNLLNEAFCASAYVPATNSAMPVALDADDSWHVGAASATLVARLMGGYTMQFLTAGEMVENREAALRFVLLAPDGQPAALQPYMGMFGHAVVRRTDGAVFTHLHPVGTISMAAQELFARQARGEAGTATNGLAPVTTPTNVVHDVSFPYAFPRSGDYRLWAQVRAQGRVLTGVFDVRVIPAR